MPELLRRVDRHLPEPELTATPAPLDLAGFAAAFGHGVILRAQSDADLPFARALYAAQRADELAMVPWDDAAKAAFIDHQFAAQQAHYRAHRSAADYLIVARAGTPIGRLYLDRTVDPWRLAELALVPGETGKGVGAALVAWLLAQARSAGASGVDLHVTTDNARGAAFYRGLGFVDAASDFETHRRLLHPLTWVS